MERHLIGESKCLLIRVISMPLSQQKASWIKVSFCKKDICATSTDIFSIFQLLFVIQ